MITLPLNKYYISTVITTTYPCESTPLVVYKLSITLYFSKKKKKEWKIKYFVKSKKKK